MTRETKRRLLLSKWHDRQQAHSDHLARIAHLEIDVESLMDDRNALQSTLDDMEEPHMREVLEHVMYWMQDVLVHHRPMTDPRKILTMLERAI